MPSNARHRKCLHRRYRLAVRTLRCGRNNPGSNPGSVRFFNFIARSGILFETSVMLRVFGKNSIVFSFFIYHFVKNYNRRATCKTCLRWLSSLPRSSDHRTPNSPEPGTFFKPHYFLNQKQSKFIQIYYLLNFVALSVLFSRFDVFIQFFCKNYSGGSGPSAPVTGDMAAGALAAAAMEGGR